MAIFEIPLSSVDPHFTIGVLLDDAQYQMDFDWNERSEFWHIGLAQIDGTRIVDGIKCVVGTMLLRKVADSEAPPGDLILIDTSGADVDPGRNDLGERVVLTYVDGDEIDSLVG